MSAVATASAITASVDEDADECGPQLITKLEVITIAIDKLVNLISKWEKGI